MAAAADVWQLKIPIRLTLAQDEISSPGGVKPVYLLAPRFAYLPALAQQCLAFFEHVLLSLPGQAAVTSPWFEYNGLALSWTQPLGVLHDLLAPHQDQQQQKQQQQQQPGPGVPWCLHVHYRNQPASLASAWQNSGTAQAHFLSSMKEAGHCCRGTDGCNAVMGLNGALQDELWVALNKGDAAAVARITTPLRLVPSQRQGASCPTVPVRLYIRQHKAGGTSEGILRVWDDVFSTSRPVEARQPDGSATLLAHLLYMVMPQRFPALQPPAAAAAAQLQPQQQQTRTPPERATAGVSSDPLGVSGEAAAAADARAPSPSPAAAAEQPSSSQPQQQQQQPPDAAAAQRAHLLPSGWPDARAASVLVCGVSPDWCTPLAWLHANLRAADGFLYIVVHLTETPAPRE